MEGRNEDPSKTILLLENGDEVRVVVDRLPIHLPFAKHDELHPTAWWKSQTQKSGIEVSPSPKAFSKLGSWAHPKGLAQTGRAAPCQVHGAASVAWPCFQHLPTCKCTSSQALLDTEKGPEEAGLPDIGVKEGT